MEKELSKIRHSAAHILAQAVLRLYPSTKIAIGPAIEDGFYYDFDKKDGFSNEDLKKIEKEMRKIVSENLKIEEYKIPKKELDEYLKNQPFKKELYNDFKKEKKGITFYKQGEHLELCAGNHVTSTSQVKHFKLLRIAGAYWKGDSKNKMLTRIYGTAFPSDIELKEYLTMQEEAAKRDHKKIGKELNLFMVSDLVGPGLPIWLPNGEIMRREIENLAIELEDKAGFLRVSTPHIAKKDLFLKSGHLPYYEESMFPKMKNSEGEEYYLKSMNCPLHHLIFKQGVKSYRDFPVRLAEYGTVYRNELSGTLSGLLRVRVLSMNDAHIYCTKEQIPQEIESVIKMNLEYFRIFGLTEYSFRLSKWDPKNKEKYINEPESWKFTENELLKILKKLNVKFVEVEDEAAFYGPKIDVQLKTVTGREETLSTIQLDFAAKKRFEFKYFDKDNKAKDDVFVVHRAPLSTHERLIAYLTEHYAGNFPTWLNPSQVIIVNVNDSNLDFANEILNKLKEKNVRVELDSKSESVGKKVRNAILMKPNYIITIGDKESKNKKLAIRHRSGKLDFDVSPEKFIESLLQEIKLRK